MIDGKEINMNNNLILILQSCDTYRDLNKELNKRFGWMRIKSKRDCKKLKNKLIERINTLANDKWTVGYLYGLQSTLLAYRNKLADYLIDVYIRDYDSINYNPKIFKTMYFYDRAKSKVIMLEIIGDNIEFSIMNTKVGNTFSISSSGEIQDSQKKIEDFCKQKIIEMLVMYLDNIDSLDKEKQKEFMNKIIHDYSSYISE